MADQVLVERRTDAPAVAIVTLNRPDKLNAVTWEMIDALAEMLTAADAAPDVRAIVLTGAGRGFCAGADLAWLSDDLGALPAQVHAMGRRPVLATELRTPVVAAVNGPAVGIGFTFMLACDVRFAAPSAMFSTAFAALGLVAEHGLAWLLQRAVGLGRAADLLLSARAVDGYEAVRIGLVQQVVEDRPVLEAAVEYAHLLATRCSPAAMAQIKQQLYTDANRGKDEAVDDSIARLLASLQRPDLTEAMLARAEGRAPEFPPLS